MKLPVIIVHLNLVYIHAVEHCSSPTPLYPLEPPIGGFKLLLHFPRDSDGQWALLVFLSLRLLAQGSVIAVLRRRTLQGFHVD